MKRSPFYRTLWFLRDILRLSIGASKFLKFLLTKQVEPDPDPEGYYVGSRGPASHQFHASQLVASKEALDWGCHQQRDAQGFCPGSDGPQVLHQANPHARCLERGTGAHKVQQDHSPGKQAKGTSCFKLFLVQARVRIFFSTKE